MQYIASTALFIRSVSLRNRVRLPQWDTGLYKKGIETTKSVSARAAISNLPFLFTKNDKCSSSSLTGFKKVLFNRIIAREGGLYPGYNRRKHNHSHYMIIYYQLKRLSRAFSYFSKNKIDFFIAAALKETYPSQENVGRNLSKKSLPHRIVQSKRAIYNCVDLVETDSTTLLTRNQYYYSLPQAKQSLTHAQPTSFLESIIGVADCIRKTVGVFTPLPAYSRKPRVFRNRCEATPLGLFTMGRRPFAFVKAKKGIATQQSNRKPRPRDGQSVSSNKSTLQRPKAEVIWNPPIQRPIRTCWVVSGEVLRGRFVF